MTINILRNTEQQTTTIASLNSKFHHQLVASCSRYKLVRAQHEHSSTAVGSVVIHAQSTFLLEGKHFWPYPSNIPIEPFYPSRKSTRIIHALLFE